MAHKLTINLPEAAYAALQAAAASASRTPEELAAETLSERFNEAPEEAQPQLSAESGEKPSDAVADWREQVRAVMRARGHLAEPTPRPPRPGATPLPPRGTPERRAYEEELAEDLSDALERSGLSILDLIERR